MRSFDSTPAFLATAAAAGLLSIASAQAAPSAQDEAVYQQYLDFHRLVSGGRITPGWLPDGNTFWYAEGGPNDREIIKVDPATDTAAPLFDVARLREALTESLGYEPAGDGVPFAQLAPAGANAVAFSLEGESYVLDLESYTLTRKPPPGGFSLQVVVSEADRGKVGTFMRERFLGMGPMPSPEAMSPDGSLVATIRNYNLALRATIDGQELPVTSDGTEASFWDVEGALWSPWSPNSQFLAVIRQHAENLPKVPTIQWLKPLEQVIEVYTIPAGSELYRSELYLLDRSSMQPVAVDLGDTQDQFVRILSWLPDSSELILARYNRVLSKVEIQAVNPLNGAVRTVMTEQSKTFLTNHHEAIWATETGFTLLPDGSGFVWNSERSGWDHLYLYGMDGQLQRQLTSGEWPVKDVLRIDQQDGWVYFTCHSDQKRPYDTHVCRVGLDGKGYAQLTEGDGQHAPNISPSADYFVDTFSSVDVPAESVLRKTDGALIRSLGKADISRLEAVGWVPPKEYVVKAADGKTDLWATVYFPYDFDPSKQYPLVEYIYAGPQTTMRPMDFGDQTSLLYRAANFNRALTHLGFIVVTLDARGTPERSKAFHDAVYMNWGQFEIDDHATAIRQLAEQTGFIDLDRVGIWGASWGGHFTARALAQAPDLYKVGISNVPGYDSRAFILYETYLGMPQENKAGYDAADALSLAPLIQGELYQTGGINDTATQKDVFRMSDLLIKLGKQHRQFSYPNTGHGAMGVTGEYDMELKKDYFVEMLDP
jgi:dipeptidyl aminopeptidase/acylaminoacyl peptidase